MLPVGTAEEQIGTAMAQTTQFWTIFKYRPKFWKVPRTQTKVNQRLFPLCLPAEWPLPVSTKEEQIWTNKAAKSFQILLHLGLVFYTFKPEINQGLFGDGVQVV